METKYETLKRALKRTMKNCDNHPLSSSAKSAYLEAKQNMIDYYNELTYGEQIELFTLSTVEK